MEDNVMYYFLMINFILSIIYFTYFYVKVVYDYLIDGADLRVCTMSQCFVYILLMVTELISFRIRGTLTSIDIYLFRTYISFVFYFLSASRLLGYKSLFFPKKLKNVLYTIITAGFYLTTTLEVFFLEKLNNSIMDNFNHMDYVCYSIMASCNLDGHIVLHSIPAVYSSVCFIFIVLFDSIEKRGYRCILFDVLTDFPILFYIYTSLSKSFNVYSKISIIFMFVIPLFSLVQEIKSIIHSCIKERNDTEYIRTLVKKSYKALGARQLYNARLIHKMIKDNPSLKNVLPTDIKYEGFMRLVRTFEKEDS